MSTDINFSQTFYNEADTTTTIKQITKGLRSNLKKKFPDKGQEWIDTRVETLLSMNGIDFHHFNFIHTIEKIITSHLNDVSIDDNANKNEKSIAGIFSEATAPIKKVVGYDYLYRVMKEMYGKKRAKYLASQMYDYSIGLSDSSNIMVPYCYALDASKIVTCGREFGQLPSSQSKKVSSYISALCETLHQMSSHLAGAIAIGTFFFDIAHLSIFKMGIGLDDIKNNEKCRKHFENEFQQFVHSVNHLSRNGIESPFTNLSVFDKEKISYIVKNDFSWYFPVSCGMQEDDWYKYVTDYIYEIQNIFLDFFDKGDPMNGGIPYRFPVLTANFSKEKTPEGWKLMDEDFLENMTSRDIHKYNIFTSEGTKVASCCFDENEEILVKGSNFPISKMSFKDAFSLSREECMNPKIYHNGFWRKFKRVTVPYNDKYLNIKTINNKSVVVTKDHVFPTLRGDVAACNLTTDDYLMFSTNPLNGEMNSKSYNDGLLIGAYLGDGYLNNGQLVLSLNEDKVSKLNDILDERWGNTRTYKNNCIQIHTNNNGIISDIEKYCIIGRAENKSLNIDTVLRESVDFRRGILDGYYITDGGNANRIYTTSENMVSAVEILCTSLGMQTTISVEDRTDEPVVIRGETYNRNHPLYCIRWYARGNKPQQSGIYKFHNNSCFFKIGSIEEVYGSTKAYCVEMVGSEPYFTLPNGIITHNCRLISDTEMLELAAQSNSFGAGAVGSLGSHRVATINFNRIALECTSLEDFWKKYEERILEAREILMAHKTLIMKLADKGLQMFVSNGWINMRRMYSTFGIMGVYECKKTLKERFNTDDGVLKEALTHLNDMIVKFTTEDSGFVYNIEQIPAESYAVRLCNSDKLLFGDDAVPYQLYANQWVPLWEDATIWEKMEEDGKYNSLLTGGGIVHATVGERITKTQAKQIIRFAVNCGCEHFALNAIYSKCENGHISMGDISSCPQCSSPIVDKYTRVVGFLTPVSSWNKTRREWEFPRRTKVKM